MIVGLHKNQSSFFDTSYLYSVGVVFKAVLTEHRSFSQT